ncbi:unnamed protein product [Effrenium voratum]|nr:unnamed protein product [Effrenium voratum]
MGTSSERNRAEITSLRQEISSLLTANGRLHQHLGQLNGYLPDGAEQQADLTGAPGVGFAPEARSERRSWEAVAEPVTAQCPPQGMRVEGTPAGVTGSSAATLATMLRERDDLHQRLQATELARCAAQQRHATAEAALQRASDDLERQRKLISASVAAREQSANDAELLRQQLREAQDKLAELDLALATRSERVRISEREYAEVRVEFDALAAANDAIRKELTATRHRIAAEQQGCRAAEAELSECQAKLRAGEVEFAAELESLSNRRRTLEASLNDSSAALAAAEAEVADARAQSLGLRAQLEVLEAARDQLAAQEQQASAKQREEVQRLESAAAQLSFEAEEISRRHAQAKASLEELQKAQERDTERTQEDAFSQARAAAAQRCRRAREEVAEAEQKLGSLLRQLGEERRQGLQLARELTAAREAASAAGVLRSKPARRSRSVPKANPAKVASPWSESDLQETWSSSALRMHRELDLLQRWKADALTVLQKMQADVSCAQEKYREQLEQNQTLQHQLEHVGWPPCIKARRARGDETMQPLWESRASCLRWMSQALGDKASKHTTCLRSFHAAKVLLWPRSH